MRNLLILVLVSTFGLSACNTVKGFTNGVGKDVSSVGGAVEKGGNYVQEKVPAP